jgi:hypothetical protein
MIHSFRKIHDMSSLVLLNTRDSETSVNYNTFWQIQRPQLNTLKGFKLSLQNIEFANTVYPINANNNIVTFDEGGGSLTATLTANSYTGSELASHLKTQMDAAVGAGDTYTVTYDSQSKKLTIASTGTYFFVSGVANHAFDELGITTLDDAAAASRTSDVPINVSGSQYVDIVTDLSNLNYSSSTTAHVLARVPLNVAFGQVVFYEPNNDGSLFSTVDHLDYVSMALRDDKGNLWELPSNSYVSLVLKLELPLAPMGFPPAKRQRLEPIIK